MLLLLSGGSPEARGDAANALFNLAANADYTTLIAKAGGIKPLVLLLSGGSPEASGDAANALCNLAIGNADDMTLIAMAGASSLWCSF